MLVKIDPGIDVHRVAKCQGSNAFRKSFGVGHGRAIDQYRHQGNTPIQRRLDFDADKVMIVRDSFMVVTMWPQPLWADDDNQHIRQLEGGVYIDAKIAAPTDIDVHINRGFAIARF